MDSFGFDRGVPPPGVRYDPAPPIGPDFGPGFEPSPFRR